MKELLVVTNCLLITVVGLLIAVLIYIALMIQPAIESVKATQQRVDGMLFQFDASLAKVDTVIYDIENITNEVDQMAKKLNNVGGVFNFGTTK